ncbi:MAG TPA: hypothetical protein VI027_06065 [Rubrobacteraceae bacterium]
MRWEHLKLTRARLARVTNTRPLVRRLRLRIRVLGRSVNRGNGSPVAPTPDEEVSRGGERELPSQAALLKMLDVL